MDQRDQLVASARAFLGVRFSHQGRHPATGLDCLGLLIATASRAGVTLQGKAPEALDDRQYGVRPDTDYLQRMLGAHLQAVDAPEIGDVLLLSIDGRPQHLALVSDYPVADELGMIHAYAVARKVVEHRLDEAWRQKIHQVYRVHA